MRVADDDLAPQLVSWTIASLMGAAWLIVVHFTALPVVRFPVADAPGPVIGFSPGVPTPAATPNLNDRASRGRSSAGRANASSPTSQLDLTEVFTAAVAGRVLAPLTDLLAKAATPAPEGGAHPAGSKSSMSGGADATTPGMMRFSSGIGKGGASAHVGEVQRGGTITRADVHVQPLPVVAAPALGAVTADAAEMGSFVRARVSQLQSCYERAGGTDLAGIVALRLTIGAGGAVQGAEIVRRSWSGPGAAATEACLLALVRGWRLPSGNAGATITLPISFTRGT